MGFSSFQRADDQPAEERGRAEERQWVEERAWIEQLGLRLPHDDDWVHQPWLTPASCYHLGPLTKTVAASQLLRDLPILRMFLRQAYIGWEFWQERGWEWERFFAEWTRFLEGRSGDSLSVAEAFSPVREAPLDNHSGPCIPQAGLQSRSQTVYTDQALRTPAIRMRNREGRIFPIDPGDPAQGARACWVFEPATGRLRPVSALSYPSRLGTIDSLFCGSGWIPVRAVEEGTPEPLETRPLYDRIAPHLGYLRIPTLTFANSEYLLRWEEWLPPETGQLETLIVDVRGNEGGAYEGAIPVLGMLTGVRDFIVPAPVRRKNSSLTALLTWGFVQARSRDFKPPLSDTLRSRLQHALDNLLTPHVDEVSFEERRVSWPYSEHRFPTSPTPGFPSILVLADNGCGSDGEALVWMLAAVAGSTVAGSNTFGIAQFTNPGYFVLPHTRIPYRLAMGMSDIYGDQRSFDGYGIAPDILLPTRESQKREHFPALVATIHRAQNQMAG
jgi:hypothetical protein